MIDAEKNEINVNIDKKELEIRKKLWVKPDLKFKSEFCINILNLFQVHPVVV